MPLLRKIFPHASDLDRLPSPDGPLPATALGFIVESVRPLRLSFIVWAMIATVAASLTATESWFFGRLISALTEPDKLPAWQSVTVIVGAYILLAQIMQRICWQTCGVLISRVMPLLGMLGRRRLADWLQSHSYLYFQNDFAGRLAGRVLEMPDAMMLVVSDVIESVLQTVVFGVASAIVFSTLNWHLGLLAVVYLALSVAWGFVWGPRVEKAADLATTARQTMRGRYVDSIGNILLVKLFARERHERQLFGQAMTGTATREQIERRQVTLLYRGQHVLNASMQSGVMLLCIWFYRQGVLSIGSIATALSLSALVATSAWNLLQISGNFFSRFATISESLRAIGTPHEIADGTASPAPASAAAIRIDNITFGYPARPIFSNFSLEIPHGQKVGLVGPSGAGKSTLVQLILRLVDVHEGSILVRGTDVRDLPQASLRGLMTVIPQASDLMHRSIGDNIGYGRLDATEAEIEEAAKRAFIHETIAALADGQGLTGYAAMVGERGVKLSGGQRQRIAIARASLRDSPILILDEATSALDSESERLIQQSFGDLFRDRTVIAIAHRLSTIAHLDRIVVLDQGRIVEDGTHAALIAAGGLYARLWSLQSAEFLGEATPDLSGRQDRQAGAAASSAAGEAFGLG